MNDKDFLRLALEEAEKANDKHKFGAVVVKNGKVLSSGHNVTQEKKDPTCHAEIMAIRKACKVLNNKHIDNCILYSSAEPCFMCFTAAAWAHISKIVFSKPRKDLPDIGYHTFNFNIHDLNAKFDRPLEIEVISQDDR